MTLPINQLVGSMAEALIQNEKLSVAMLNAKLQKLIGQYPSDHTIGAIANVLHKAENHKPFITRSELKDIYQRFHTRNTKFADLFQSELGLKTITEKSSKTVDESLPIADIHSSVADPILANALKTVFDASIPYKSFSVQQGKQAEKIADHSLSAWNFKANKLSVDTGNEHFVVIRADYDTPKGTSSILVPIEFQMGKALEPSFFIGNVGPYQLNHTNLKNYILAQAGQGLKLKATEVMQLLTTAVHPKAEVSTVEMALTKLNANKTTQQEYLGDAILGQSLDALASATLQMPQAPEFTSFAEKLSTPDGIAEMQFGREKVGLGADAVRRTLAQYGITHSVIKVADCSENSIFYAVSAHNGRLAIRVPVKMTNNRLQTPDVFVCNGSVSALNTKELQRAMAQNQMDTRVAAITSPQYGLKPSDLIENVRQAMIERNFSKAEDALNVLMECGDPKAYGIAFNVYKDGLSSEKTATPEKQCSMIIQSKNSKYPLCGHTGLPLHKTFVDKFGNCQTLYRKGMDETTEELYLMHTKIFG
jgi:hypothetical protein